MNGQMIRVLCARVLRQAARRMFDEVDLSGRDSEWVDRDSYDAGLVAAANYLLHRADALEAGELEADQ